MATIFGGPYNKDYNILGSILGSPYLGKLPGPYTVMVKDKADLGSEVLEIWDPLKGHDHTFANMHVPVQGRAVLNLHVR